MSINLHSYLDEPLSDVSCLDADDLTTDDAGDDYNDEETRILRQDWIGFAPELKEEHRDVLIIYSENSERDQEKARELKTAIDELIFSVDNNDNIHGMASLMDETVCYVTSYIDRLDEALKFHTLIFAIFSKEMLEDGLNMQMSCAALWQTIEERGRNNTFIPIYPYRELLDLPAYVSMLQPLNMQKSNWKDGLRRVISCHLQKRLDRQARQRREQRRKLRSLARSRTKHTSKNHEQRESHELLPSSSISETEQIFEVNFHPQQQQHETESLNFNLQEDDRSCIRTERFQQIWTEHPRVRRSILGFGILATAVAVGLIISARKNRF